VLSVQGYRSRTSAVVNPASIFVSGLTSTELYALNRWNVLGTISRRVSWNGGVSGSVKVFGGPGAVSEISVPPMGMVRGLVYSDANANGVREPGEEPVAGIHVRLDDGRETVTGVDGTYFFPNVVVGAHRVSLVVDVLPVRFDPPPVPSVQIQVAYLAAATLDFGVVPIGEILGRVEQLNGGEGPEPAREVVVTLVQKGFSTTTDADGVFRFDSLVPGFYTVRLEKESLPEGAVLEGDGIAEIEVGAGKSLEIPPFRFRIVIPEKPGVKVLDTEETIRLTKPKKKPVPKPPADSKPPGGKGNGLPPR